MDDEFESIEKQIIARTEQLNLTKTKVEDLKNSLIRWLQQVFPSYVDDRMLFIIEHNASEINEVPDEKLSKFKQAVLVAKEKAISRVIDELSKSEDWYSCEKKGIDVGGGLWQIIKSVDKEFIPIFNDFKLRQRGASIFGSSDLVPINLNAFRSEALERINAQLHDVLEEYCGREKGLKDLKNSLAKKKALRRWTSQI